MTAFKTKPTDRDPIEFLNRIEDSPKRADCLEILALMAEITEKKPKMWGTSIIGFGSYHYLYASGREGDYFVTGFSHRQQNITLYIMPKFAPYEVITNKLGKFKLSKSCLYIKTLNDIDRSLLQQLISKSVEDMTKIHDCE